MDEILDVRPIKTISIDEQVIRAISRAEFAFWATSPLAVGPGWKDALIEAIGVAVIKTAGSVQELRRLRRESQIVRNALNAAIDRATESDRRVQEALEHVPEFR